MCDSGHALGGGFFAFVTSATDVFIKLHIIYLLPTCYVQNSVICCGCLVIHTPPNRREVRDYEETGRYEPKVYELKYSDESDGTKKLIAALPVLLLALQEGRLVIIDELDAKLHPKLLRYVISMFKNPKLNTRGAQLLFTSHDMTTMKNTVFRRDEIWFAAENPNHESEIYSLYEIRREDNERVNSTAAFDKQYMEGRYGADPYLTNMLSGGDWT